MSIRLTLVTYLLLPIMATFLTPPAHAQDAQANNEFYEVRTYVLGDNGDDAALDEYLQAALLPALARQHIGPVGVFAPTSADETNIQAVFVVIPYTELAQVATVRDAINTDAEYATAAKAYLDRPHTDPPFARIRSELLSSMACWPSVKVAAGSLDNDERVYELRLYESANERIGDLKVEMFNHGEVPIFLDCAITPIFVGQCILGPQMPSLTYLTMYENEAARQQAWKDFRVHPDWQVLSKNAKYAGTVSRIDKFVLAAKPYSQM